LFNKIIDLDLYFENNNSVVGQVQFAFELMDEFRRRL
jgi:hypothetical protein